MPSSKRILLSCLVILLSACLFCGGALSLSAAGLAITNSIRQSQATPLPTLVPLTDLPEAQNNSIPVDVTALMDQIQQQVIQLRGFTPDEPLDRELLSPEELRQNVLTDFLADYTPEEAQKDSAVLTAFGLLEPGFDLLEFYQDLYSEQIAGYYDNETKEMYIVQGEGFGGQERSTYAHEYLHVLQDQTFGIADGLNFSDADCEIDSERCLAVQSLLEGDASVTEQAWLSQYGSQQDRTDISDFYSSFSSPVFDSAPAFMRQDFIFPYRYGAEFVYSLRDRGGWEAVNAAYLDPPLSSEQILHPDQYPMDKPVTVKIPDLSGIVGGQWQEIDSGTLGEWYLYLILTQGYRPETWLADDTAREAAAGWDGDAYRVYQHPDTMETLLVLSVAMDSEQDARELSDAFMAYGNSRWGEVSSDQSNTVVWNSGQEKAILHTDRNQLWLVISPDVEIARNIMNMLPPST